MQQAACCSGPDFLSPSMPTVQLSGRLQFIDLYLTTQTTGPRMLIPLIKNPPPWSSSRTADQDVITRIPRGQPPTPPPGQCSLPTIIPNHCPCNSIPWIFPPDPCRLNFPLTSEVSWHTSKVSPGLRSTFTVQWNILNMSSEQPWLLSRWKELIEDIQSGCVVTKILHTNTQSKAKNTL